MSGDDLDALLEQMVPGSGAVRTTDPDAPSFPDDLDLQPREVIGRGTTGWVFRAFDPVLDREVAVKISRPDGGARARQSLLAEARTTTALAHPAVLAVHRIVARDGLLCVVFELAPDRTLSHLLGEWMARPDSAWPRVERLVLLRAIADVVSEAHRQQVVHGDLKPGNIAVSPSGLPTVLDWAGLEGGEGTFSGTPEYAAPEQLRGAVPGAASDVFALAALVYELLTLRPLRPRRGGEALGAYLARHADASAPDVSAASDPTSPLGTWLSGALQASPEARPDAHTLREALDALLSGQAEAQRRRQVAEAHLEQAREAFMRFQERERRLSEEKRVVDVLQAKIPPWAPPADKAPLWAAQARALQIIDAQAESWTTAIETAHQAAALQPDSAEAHALLADLWWDRMQMAEARGYVGERTLAERRVRAHDPGRYAATLDATARLSLEVPDADGAEVVLARVHPDGPRLVQEAGEPLPLPLRDHPLAPGSWVATVRAPDGRSARVPLWLHRLAHLQLAPVLRTEAQVGEGFVHVPAGPFRMGGDPEARAPVEACAPWLDERFVRRTAVTSGEYLAFLEDLDADEAARRAPSALLPVGRPVPLWPDGALPDGWDPSLPVVGIGRDDAEAYAAWLSARTGRPLRLPTEEEWEKAARGADGRPFPWGPMFDPAFCRMRDSVAGSPSLAPVGSAPLDVSPYGVCDVAGGVREWTASSFAGDRVVVRGGSWSDDARACRLASREAVDPRLRSAWVGFRLVSEVPADG